MSLKEEERRILVEMELERAEKRNERKSQFDNYDT